MRYVPFIDATGIHNFREAVKWLKKSSKIIILSGVNPNVRKELDSSSISSIIGENHIYDNFDAALQRAKDILKK